MLPKALIHRRWLPFVLPVLLLALGHCSRASKHANPPNAVLAEMVDARYIGDADADSRASQAPGVGYWAHVDSVSYAGMATCAICHPQQHESYIRTGMGRSFAPATRERSDADFEGHPEVHDADRDLTYRPFWRGEALMVAEFRLLNGDTTHYREEQIDHIIGSGQHTNSHLIERDGYLYQAPITYYTQEGRWDLAPGFDGGHNTRFERPIESECITCHNGHSLHRTGSRNAYEAIPAGIDCERCHGPGAQHVRQKLAGLLVDTAEHIDYSIVHPGKLALDRQLDLCQRCHLQGIAVLNDRSDWYDFKPGDRIEEHWNVFLPDYGALETGHEGASEAAAGNGAFLMASQAERLQESPCFVSTGGFSCITCHNPHLSIRETPRKALNNPCISCHGGAEQADGLCGLPLSERVIPDQAWESRVYAGGRLPKNAERSNDCSACHMPRSGAVDIPHVTITDHKVRIPSGQASSEEGGTFRRLDCLTDTAPAPLTRARAYLRFYEAFNRNAAFLDSADYWLQKSRTQPDLDADLYLRSRLHALWLREDFPSALSLLEGFSLDPETSTDAWTCYRAGEVYAAIVEDASKAEAWFARATVLLPLDAGMKIKQANALAQMGEAQDAMQAYSVALTLDPKRADAHSNLGFLKLQSGIQQGVEEHFQKACALDPDYLPARLNLIQFWMLEGKTEAALSLLDAQSRLHPESMELKALRLRMP